MYLKQTKSYGSTSHPYTRTPTKASRAVAKIGEYPQCRPQLRPIPHHTPRCLMNPCTEATRDHITRMAAIVVAVARQLPRTSVTTDQKPVTISARPSNLAIQHKVRVTMTWSFPSARCTEPINVIPPHRKTTISAHTFLARDGEFMDAGTAQRSTSIEASAATVHFCSLLRLQRRFRWSVFPPISLCVYVTHCRFYYKYSL